MTQPQYVQWSALPQRDEVMRAARTLDKLLLWLRWMNIVMGGFTLLLGLAGLIAMGLWRSIAEVFGVDTDYISSTLVTLLGGFYLLILAATIAFYWLTVLLIGWCREYLTMLRGVTLHEAAPNLSRLSALHQTFEKYIVATQWAMPALTLLMVLFPLTLYPYLPNTGLGELLIIGLAFLIPLGITSVINWLLLASLKTWLSAATSRMRGAKLPLMPSANVVGNWFIFVLVLLGISALGGLGNLLTPFTLAASLATLPQEADFHISGGLIAVVALMFTGLALLALAQQVLLFLALLHYRTFILQSAALLDHSSSPPTHTGHTDNLPMNSSNPYAAPQRISLDKLDS